ncbi:MAG TPA: hypothetical protein VIM65_01350 [Cyclobacteriaceae bacterium]
MKMNELTPGYYKIQRKQAFNIGKRGTNNNTVHILRVEGVGEKCKYFIDHTLFGEHPSKMAFAEDYEVISRYDREPVIQNCAITLSFSDSSGQKFEFRVVDAWALRNVFLALTWLQKPFGFVRRRRV